MKREKETLLADVMAGERHREATLLAARGVLRRRRYWRRTRQAGLLLALAAAIMAVPWEARQRAPVIAQVTPAAKITAAHAAAQELTDDQLLALFPNTPVGLASLPNGKKMFLFLRPEDQAKYVTRL